MFRKLTYHEFRATGRMMWPYFIGMVLLSLLTRFAAIPMLNHNDFFPLNLLGILIVMAFFIGMFTLGLAPLIVSAWRFKKNVLSGEGYLTMSLPISTNQLLLSKLLVSAVWYALCAVLLFVCVLLLIGDLNTVAGMPSFVTQVFRVLQKAHTEQILQVLLAVFELLMNLIAGVVMATLIVYAAYAIGFSANRSKSFLTVVLIFAFFHAAVYAIVYAIGLSERIGNRWMFESGINGMCAFFGLTFFLMTVVSVIFYAVTHYFIANKLNLE